MKLSCDMNLTQECIMSFHCLLDLAEDFVLG